MSNVTVAPFIRTELNDPKFEVALTPVQQAISDECTALADFLIAKNRAYGSSFSDPINMFSKATAREQLAIRIDDKLNRIAKGGEFPGDDTVLDLIGYLVLLRVLGRLA